MKKYFLILLFFLLAGIVCAESNFKIYQDMLVAVNLRLRTSKYDGRKIVTVLNAGTRVKILNIGEEETIDSITSNWVEIEVQKGATDKDGTEVKYGVFGWCFGGYLNETTQIARNPDYANGNGIVISEYENKEQNILIRKHYQIVVIGDLANDYQMFIYSDTNKTSIVGELKHDDEVQINEIWYITNKSNNHQDIWFSILSNENNGFLYFGGTYFRKYDGKYINYQDPYENNRWEILEIIDNKWTVRKLKQTLAVFSEKGEVELRDKPSETDSRVLSHIPSSYKNEQGQINLEIEAVTEEIDSNNANDRWVRVTYNGKTGWIYGSYLSAERGGPKYYIPEYVINFALGWY